MEVPKLGCGRSFASPGHRQKASSATDAVLGRRRTSARLSTRRRPWRRCSVPSRNPRAPHRCMQDRTRTGGGIPSRNCGAVPPENPIRCRWWCSGRQHPTRKRQDPGRRGEGVLVAALGVWILAHSGNQVRSSAHGRWRPSPWGSTTKAARERCATVAMVKAADAGRGDHSAGVAYFGRPVRRPPRHNLGDESDGVRVHSTK